METYHGAKQLNLLLKRNYDAERGYQEASEEVQNNGLKEFFKNNYEERNRFGHEIKELLKKENAAPNKGTTLEADAHRAFMKLKEMVSTSTPEAILEECKRGEEFALNDYKDAVADPTVSESHRKVLSDQMNSIKTSIDQIEKLKLTLA